MISKYTSIAQSRPDDDSSTGIGIADSHGLYRFLHQKY